LHTTDETHPSAFNAEVYPTPTNNLKLKAYTLRGRFVKGPAEAR